MGHQQHIKVPPLPVVRPAPVAAAAGESPTASAPPPAVYGYTPEQRVSTERRESGKLSTRRQTEGGRKRRGNTQRRRDFQIPREREHQNNWKDDKELVGEDKVIGTHLVKACRKSVSGEQRKQQRETRTAGKIVPFRKRFMLQLQEKVVSNTSLNIANFCAISRQLEMYTLIK